jgi:hypothetical protein
MLARDLDFWLKVSQLVFYVSAIAVAWLTYRSARRGLLSPVHTEYQKRVIERLSSLSTDIWAEFEEHPDGLSHVFVAEICERLKYPKRFNDTFGPGSDAIPAPRFEAARRLGKLYTRYSGDPFLPRRIRMAVLPLIKHRVWAMSSAADRTLARLGSDAREDAAEHVAREMFMNFLPAQYRTRRTRDWATGLRQMIQTHLQSFDPFNNRSFF